MISSSGALPERSRTARAARMIAAHLHLVDLRVEDPEPAAARAEHRVRLLQLAHALERLLELRRARGVRSMRARSTSLRHLLEAGQELVQRRVEQADRDRQARHLLEQPLEVLLLERQQLRERGAPVLLGRRP